MSDRWSPSFRKIDAFYRKQEREARKRLRELERQNKELAKLSAMELAKLEVESYENQLEVLLSVHKQQSSPWDWTGFAASLAPPPPEKSAFNEFKARQRMAVSLQTNKVEAGQPEVERAMTEDERAYQEELKVFVREKAEWEKMKVLAHRILSGDHKAYIDALTELSPLAEISDFGSSLHFTVHSSKLMACTVKVNEVQFIPKEVKTLTSAGKLSCKAMPKARFHEIYQDYVCGCILRVAREIFALLPVDSLIITASTDHLDLTTGISSEKPVLSVFIPRADFSKLDFERLDPSDSMENFTHRGDFKASRKSGAFLPIIPLTPMDIAKSSTETMQVEELFALAQKLRADLSLEMEQLKPRPNPTA